MAKKEIQGDEPKFKKTLNEIDRLWIDTNHTMSAAKLVEKFISCYGGNNVPSKEAIEKYRERHKNMASTTKINAETSTFAKKGTSTVMTQAASEKSDTKGVGPKQPPWVTRIYKDK